MSPALRVADVAFNELSIREALERAKAEGVEVAVFPELCLTGYSCADLFYQEALLSRAAVALAGLAAETERLHITAVVGLPVAVDGRTYNCAALLSCGTVVGVVPKIHLPTTNEYYEQRWFSSGQRINGISVHIGAIDAPFGTDMLFRAANFPACVIGIEICEDLWAVQPPSGALALAGATLILNPSASNELLGKADYRRDLVRQQSARCLAAYAYACAGPGESTTDTVFGGHSMVAENGAMLVETERFRFDTQIAVSDVDLQRLLNERVRNSGFSADVPSSCYREIRFQLPQPDGDAGTLMRVVARLPFVPAGEARRAEHCREVFAIQSAGLARRLLHTGVKSVVIGVSGGLDSTLALLVAARAFDSIGLPRSGVIGVMMSGFGTTERTKSNADHLIGALEVSLKVIPIGPAVTMHFRDIGHPENLHDVTYENAQARERTQILMDLANQQNALVVGTGDLSEAALGWCTFNGDHMSMYHINAGVPKTLVQAVIEWCADDLFAGEASSVLREICATPISPELLPVGDGGELVQKTEDLIGPYELHDFFLFHVIRHQYPARKIMFLAHKAFGGDYAADEIRKWLEFFYLRFFSQQFKRSAMPDGPKVGTVALSPRGDWRMPSDAVPALWLEQS